MSNVEHIRRVEHAFDVEVALPGSKSIALRQLVMSALAASPTTITGIPDCDDIDAMIESLERLGAQFTPSDNAGLRVTAPPQMIAGAVDLDLRMSGTSLRILLGTALLRQYPTNFDGHRSLRERPNGPMLSALESLGAETQSRSDGQLPISITGPREPGQRVAIDTSISSQFLTSLLLAAPHLRDGLTIDIVGAQVSAPYVRITRSEMAKRSVVVRDLGLTTLVVEPQPYAGGSISIEGDASAASYHAALATLHGGTVRMTNLGAATEQGDYAFFALCEEFGAVVERSPTQTIITGPPSLRSVTDVDMTSMPDAAPTLMAIAPYLPAPIRITGLATLRHKECDRITCPTRELRKAGVEIEEGPDFVVIAPLREARPATFDTYDDHRMAMSMAVFASGTDNCAIEDPACVAKTYSNFWSDFSRIYAA